MRAMRVSYSPLVAKKRGKRRRQNAKRKLSQRWSRPPTERIGTPAALDESADLIITAMDDKRFRARVGPDLLEMAQRVKSAPVRSKYYKQVTWDEVDLEPMEGGKPWEYIDHITGHRVVQEDDGRLMRELPHPPNAYTLGELVMLEHRLMRALSDLADQADRQPLSEDEKERAMMLSEAHEGAELLIALLRVPPEEQDELRVSMIEQLAKSLT